MRIPYMFRLQDQGQNQDQSYEMAWMGLWSLAEIALGIMIACTLTLPKLLRAKSKEINSFFTTLSLPFVSLKTLVRTNMTRTTSHTSGLTKIDSYKIKPQNRPRVKDVVHAPVGLTIDSDTMSFIRRDLSLV